MKTMKRHIYGLTILQPWAAAIVWGNKRIENRDWRVSNKLIGEFIAIHAGKKMDNRWETDHFIWDVMNCEFGRGQVVMGAIIGVAVLDGFTEASDDPWFFGKWGWKLRDVVPIKPVPCRGKQGLWSLPPEVLGPVRANYQAAKLEMVALPLGITPELLAEHS